MTLEMKVDGPSARFPVCTAPTTPAERPWPSPHLTLPLQILAAEPTKEGILPFIKTFEKLIRCAALASGLLEGSGLQLPFAVLFDAAKLFQQFA